MSLFQDIKGWTKQAVKEALPPESFFAAKRIAQRRRLKLSGAFGAFHSSAARDPSFLDASKLADLSREFPGVTEPELAQRFTDDGLLARGQERKDILQNTLGAAYERAQVFFETGGADGMVGRALRADGKHCRVSDIYSSGFDPRAAAAGVEFVQMSASALELKDASIDVLYSFDAFEHFDDPKRALEEAIRVVKPGGHIFLSFGPLYHSAEGMHLGARSGIPHIQNLFTKGDIDAYLVAQGGEAVNHGYCNELPLAYYRELFESYTEQLATRLYIEDWNLDGLDLIARYPDCFRGADDNIEEFLVAIIDVCFQRIK